MLIVELNQENYEYDVDGVKKYNHYEDGWLDEIFGEER